MSSEQWTFTHTNGTETDLGHILINKKWKNIAMNCQTFDTFEKVSSDHLILSSANQRSFKANKKKQSALPPYNWSRLTSHLKAQYTIAVRNKFETL